MNWFLENEAQWTNRRRMYWAALGMMLPCMAATIYHPERTPKADSNLMAQHLALFGLVGAYFMLGNKGGK